MEQEFIFKCECGCSKLTVDEDEDGYVNLSHYFSSFYGKQSVIKDRIIERIKMLWFVLRGKDFHLYELYISPENWSDFKKWMNNEKI
jgi:hypothetical protein